MGKEQKHAGSVTSGPNGQTPPHANPESEKEPEKPQSGPAKKTKPLIGQYRYIGQDDNRFLFQDRDNKKCYTIDKNKLEYRGETEFRLSILESLQK